ncbi:MAG: hypothetical protein J7578_17615 [Chitinophagaceae bacterium]|nr:hypothetical protein [Chitinophagaceae bacterium]
MKQRIPLLAATLFFVLGISNLSRAQKVEGANPDQASISASTDPKIENPAEDTFTENAAIKSLFLTLFPNATGQKWTQNGTNSFVSFLNNGRNASACFSAKGKLNYAITECRKEHLPKDLLEKIRKDYADWRLFRAIEIKAYGETAWQAIMENATGFITLKYTLDELEEIQAVKK